MADAAQIKPTEYDVHYTLLTNYVAFMGYTILVWDHFITFGDEAHYIWAKVARPNPSQRPLIYLFLFNRYFTPLVFIGNFTAYLGQWDSEHCKHFVRYEGACTAIALAVTELILWLRVRALYWNRRAVPGALLAVWLVQQIVSVWLLMNGEAVKHSESFDRACTMIFSKKIGTFPPSLSAWFPLLYDTLVICLVLFRCIQHRKSSTSHIIDTLIRDGILYYGILFSINFLLAIMIIAAPDATKNITAQLEQLLTVAMISRITLSLQREGGRGMCDDTSLLVDTFEAKNDDIQHIEDIELYESCNPHIRHRASEDTKPHRFPHTTDRPLTSDRSLGSETRREHISVVAVSPPNRSLGTIRNWKQLVTRAHPGPSIHHDHDGGRRHAQGDDADTSTMRGPPTTTTSLGVISISPQHTEEAAQAASRWARDVRAMNDLRAMKPISR